MSGLLTLRSVNGYIDTYRAGQGDDSARLLGLLDYLDLDLTTTVAFLQGINSWYHIGIHILPPGESATNGTREVGYLYILFTTPLMVSVKRGVCILSLISTRIGFIGLY